MTIATENDKKHWIEMGISDRVSFKESLKEFILTMESHYFLMVEDVYQKDDEWQEDNRLHDLYQDRLTQLKKFREEYKI